MEEELQIKEDVIIPGSELNFTASRSGGPGGQHVNKTSSKVTLHWNAATTCALDGPARDRMIERLQPRLTSDGVLNINVDEERSQHRNRQIARSRLKEIVAAQGGDTSYIDDPEKFPTAQHIRKLPAPKRGYVHTINASQIAKGVHLLGAGADEDGGSKHQDWKKNYNCAALPKRGFYVETS